MSLKKEVSRTQVVLIVAATLLVFGGLGFAALRLREQQVTQSRPTEMAPVVGEEIQPPAEGTRPVAATADPTGEQARRQEALENLKFGLRTGR
jgi:hypothetical protein